MIAKTWEKANEEYIRNFNRNGTPVPELAKLKQASIERAAEEDKAASKEMPASKQASIEGAAVEPEDEVEAAVIDRLDPAFLSWRAKQIDGRPREAVREVQA